MGHGHDDVQPLDVQPLDDHELDELRRIGDPEADGLAAELVARYPGLDEGALVRLVIGEMEAGTGASDDKVREWLLEGPPLPDWADRDRIKRGQDFFGRWPLPITASLFCVSLPGAYAAADGARVLAITSDLATKNVTRRVAETGRMLIDVMDLGRESPAALEPGGQGYLTVRGVRLLHGVVRETLRASGRVDPAWGVPVNQEDLLGTLLTFTSAVFEGLDRLGIPYDPEEAEDYLHTWCVIGEMLGIERKLLPLDRHRAAALMDRIAERHHERSDAGDLLMAALLRHMETSMPLALRRLPATLTHRLLRPEVASLLDVPPPAWWSPVLGAVARCGSLVCRLPRGSVLVQAPTALLGRSMIRMYVDRTLDGEGAPFRLDAAAAARLSIGQSRVRRTMRSRRRRIRAKKAGPVAAARRPTGTKGVR